jgi:hypothetical protein
VIHEACSSRLCGLQGSTVQTAMHRRAQRHAAAATAVVLCIVSAAMSQEKNQPLLAADGKGTLT